MKKSVLLPIITALAALCFTATLLAPVQAAVYSDYARQDDYYFWFIHNYWEMWLVVDTDKDVLTLKWNAEDWMWRYYFFSYIHVWDDDGRIYWVDMGTALAHIPPDGQLTLTYNKNYKWVHAEIRWSYMVTPFWAYFVTLRCDTYVGC